MSEVEGQTVSMRELNQQTRGVIDRVAKEGETLTITDRGKPIAVIRPVSQKTGLDRLEELGLLVRRAEPGEIDWDEVRAAFPAGRDLGMTLEEYLEEERGEGWIDEAVERHERFLQQQGQDR